MLPRFYYSAAAYISGEQMFNDVNQTHLVLDSGKLVVQKDGQTIWLKENLSLPSIPVAKETFGRSDEIDLRARCDRHLSSKIKDKKWPPIKITGGWSFRRISWGKSSEVFVTKTRTFLSSTGFHAYSSLQSWQRALRSKKRNSQGSIIAF